MKADRLGPILLASCVLAMEPLHAQTVNAVPDSGTADFGIASRPIANVAANDTVNGAPAILGTGGNATVAKSGTWPTGIGLTPSTGAVSTTTAVPVGVYGIAYQLCNLNSPPTCMTANDTVTVNAVSIIANPESGTADAGIASKPIANVVANDTVNGAAVVLGTGGNATIAQYGTWPSGIALTPSSGAISTTVAVAANTYPVTYQLCDLNVPKQCVTTTDTVTVINPSIVAVADAGTATAGIASKPVANVAANDTVNGAAAALGASGNATVAANGTWPTGMTLSGGTGAITTTTATPPGVFPLSYLLCDRNVPPDCAQGTATITVAAAIVALPINGSALVNSAATPIANVAVNDTVNGVAAVLGSSGNATVSQVGSWQPGIVLNTATGAVTTSTTVPVGQYNMPYQLCDLNSTPDCATAYATVTITPRYSEVQATATALGDVEFDWGRDGIPCPSCNFGDGNDRANWTDRLGNIWIGHLDPTTGLFTSPGVNDELADTTAYFWNTYGNGPEWAFSTQNGQVISQLVYSRWQPGQPAQPQPGPGYSGAAFTTQTAYNASGGANWTPHFFPGAIGKGNGTAGTANSNLPEASQCNSDAVASVMYKNFASPLQAFTEPVSIAAGTAPTLVQLPANVVSNGIGERFVPCTHQLLLQATVPYDAQNSFQQVFWYDMDTGVVSQLTFDATTKYAGFMFQAPDFGDNYIFFTIANHTTIQVWQQSGTNPANGAPTFTLVNQITSPDPNEIYINSPEPFINCTPTCTTYIFATLSKTSDSQNGITEPNGLAVIALAPPVPPAIQVFNILVSANSLPAFQRLDPEYFITPQGPYLYYNRITPQTGSTNYKNNGEYFIDMQLGAPSGPCVGSSAEDGLVPGC